MGDKLARVLAIIALVFMGIFLAAFIAMLADRTLFNGGIGYIAMGAGAFALIIFIALKADGRGFSLTQMKNEEEFKKIEEELKAQNDKEQAENSDGADEAPAAPEENSGGDGADE